MARWAPVVIGIALGVVLATAGRSFAQSPDVDEKAQQIFTSIMSPYCPGLLLADCPSAAAFELRLEVRKRLEAGEPPGAIEQDLYRRYGEVLRAVPPPERWGLVLRIVPAFVLAFSLAALVLFVSHVRDPRAPPLATDGAADRTMDERLQQELDEVS